MHRQSYVSTSHPFFIDTLSIATKDRGLLTSDISNKLNLSIVAKITYHPKSTSSNYTCITTWLPVTENHCHVRCTLITRLFCYQLEEVSKYWYFTEWVMLVSHCY